MKFGMSFMMYLLISGSFLIVTGCTTKPFVSQAQVKQKAINDQLNGAIAYGKDCNEKNTDNPDVVLSYEQITVKGLNPSNRSELLASNKRLSAKQKAAYKNYLSLDNECFSGFMEKLQGSPFATLFQNAEAVQAINDSNLLNGKITIGEANAKKIDILQKLKGDVAALQLELTSQFQQAHNTEAVLESNRRTASAVAAQGSGYNAAQNSINNMNTRTQIIQNQTTQQLLQQNRYRAY